MMKNSLMLAVSLLVISGCSGGGQQASAPPASAPAAQQPKTALTSTITKTTVEAPAEEVYSYQPAGRRDPFMPIVVKEEKKGVAGAKAPLERYPVNEFKLSGIVWGGLGYHAMLEGPDGKGYFVKQGTIIGPNRGKVKKITRDAMIIEEQFRDPAGELNKQEITIELHRKQEGTP